MTLWLNGDYRDPDNAVVSVFDRGFMFGDGVYEVVPVRNGRPYRLDAHLARLEFSLHETRIATTMTRGGWRTLVRDTLARSNETYAQVYIQITRGAAQHRHHDVGETTPTELVMIQPQSETPQVPLTLTACEDFRWQRGDIKTTSLIAATLLRLQARERGAMDALMHRDGLVSECTASNIFAVFGDTVVTPPADHHILHGITRADVLTLDNVDGLNVTMSERPLPLSELMTADEIFVTSSSQGVRPVASIDEKAFNTQGGRTEALAVALDNLMAAEETE